MVCSTGVLTRAGSEGTGAIVTSAGGLSEVGAAGVEDEGGSGVARGSPQEVVASPFESQSAVSWSKARSLVGAPVKVIHNALAATALGLGCE
jgi:hypothetical protein